ncbi:HAD family hydrolase [Salinimonas chungwhensis]|uniref:HAD family hydrolase n=1 Tax=Salinimonas chungwhensis TaxID=265425 RepID=UPI000379D867|nr:HAD family phosphatase [Salinimonas chungwhensis]
MIEKHALSDDTRVILFDHDGTLVDSEAVHFSLWVNLLKQYDITLTESFHNAEMVGMPVAQNAIDVVEHFKLTVSPETLATQKHQLTRAYLSDQAFPLIDDAQAAITRCYDAGYKLGVVTGGSQLAVSQTLSQYNLNDYFDVIVSVEDVTHSKPAPESYAKALKMAGVLAGQAVAVEDTMHGMHSAVAAGVPCVVIPTAQSAAHHFETATASYSSLSQWLDAELI